MGQWVFVEWLLFWILGTSHFEFEWDKGNLTKNSKKHGIVGPSLNGKLLQIAFGLREGRIRVISARRPAHIKERMKYEEILRKSLKEYDQDFEIDSKKILAAMKRYKESPKKPTSVALDETTIQELKAIAEIQGIPYQVLIRVFILDGLDRLKKSA